MTTTEAITGQVILTLSAETLIDFGGDYSVWIDNANIKPQESEPSMVSS